MSSTPLAFEGTRRFTVLSRLGEGGMGVVYEALDRERDVRVALKSLRKTSADALMQFKAEFRALAELSHPNLVRFGELFEESGSWFFTMELIGGVDFVSHVRPGQDRDGLGSAATVESVADVIADAPRGKIGGALDEARLRAALGQLARGLGALHAARKIHRDIKPSNVLCTAEGRIVVLDFGLVADLYDARLRSDSNLVGTIDYMAPEQAASRPIGPEADWYSVGVMLYQSLTGALPFPIKPLQVLVAKQQRDPPPPSEIAPGIPADLDALCRALLHREPARRAGLADVLAVLAPGGPAHAAAPDPTREQAPFVGRVAELDALRDAFESSRARGVTVAITGESGVGKSSMVRQFTAWLRARHPDALILAGRCHEREAVPFKALDGVVDALAHHLRDHPDDLVALPKRAALLALAFPVLRQVEVVAQAGRGGAVETLAPQEQRGRVFHAVRELFVRLAERRPLVVVIDDLQWADADGLAMLCEILRPPEAAAMLLIGTVRAIASGDDPLAGVPGEVRRIALGALPPAEARQLTAVLLDGLDPAASAAIAAEAGGHPLFIDELVRHTRERGPRVESTPLRLDDALWARVNRLDADARALLALLAVAGAPLRVADAADAAIAAGTVADAGGFDRLAGVLRIAHLVRSTGPRAVDTIEPYHDRVREAVAYHLDADARRDCHRHLAATLEACGHADAEALADHHLGAGDAARALHWAERAGDEALAAFAFQRAARLYRRAAELAPAGATLLAKLGEALGGAGRGGEAAAALLAAARCEDGSSSPSMALELSRSAANQYLISGHMDEGLATVRDVLARFGMRLPRTPRAALLGLIGRRIQLRLRGLRFRRRAAADVPPEALARIDTCWSVGVGLALVDTIRGSHFQTRGLLLALGAGEPRRIARALALEAAYSSAAGGTSRKRTAMLMKAAEQLAHEVDDPHAVAVTTLARGMAGYLEGRWRDGREACWRAEELLRNRCTNVAWETDTAVLFSMWGSHFLGECAHLAERAPELLREAEERGDLYLATLLRTGYLNVAWLYADDPDTARRQSDDGVRRWSRQGSHLQHHMEVLSLGHIDLYRGAGGSALARIVERWPAIQGSLTLEIQHVRGILFDLRARAAVAAAAAAHGTERERLLAAAARDAKRLAKQRMAWCDPLAAFVRAGIASVRGDAAAAASHLHAAETLAEAAEMRLHAAVARRRRGALLGGDAGRTLVAAAEAWMAEERLASPDGMTALLAPGF